MAVSPSSGSISGLSLGARYVDSAGTVLFGHTGCGEQEEEALDQAPTSPVFAPDGSLLGYGEDESVGPEGVIWQLAPAGADTHAPGEVTMTPKELFVAEAIPTFGPNTGAEEPASVMSLVAENSTEGTIYLSGAYTNGQPAPAVLHYSHPAAVEPSIKEVGWITGGSTNENAGPGPCDLHKPAHEPIMLGGLSGPTRGFLALTYYQEDIGAGHLETVDRAEVVDFGEGGSITGCPTVPVTTPTQTYHAEPTNTIPASKKPLEVSSLLGKLDAGAASTKSVKWTVKFTSLAGKTEEEPPIEATYEFNGLHEEIGGYGTDLKLELNIVRAGTYEITDVVHTDDLSDEVAQPAVVDKLTVTPDPLEVTAKAPEPTSVPAHEKEARLAATAELLGEESCTSRRSSGNSSVKARRSKN